MRFAGRVAAVTGAARGIGRGIATRLASEGAHVVVQDRLEDEAELVVAELAAAGLSAVACAGDAGEPDTAERVVALALARFGRLDLVVNNAAASVRRPLLELSLDEAKATFHDTLWSGFLLTRCAARHMIDRGGGGAIVMIGSLAGELPLPAGGVYGPAKAAVEQLAMSFAVELSAHDIRVNTVVPGRIDTPGERELDGAALRLTAQRIPLGRAGLPEDVAAAVAFLLSDDARYVTGTKLIVDGGLRLPRARRG